MKKFKIYFHNNFYHQPQLPLRSGFLFKLKNGFIYLFKVFIYGIFGLCYLTGKSAINGITKIFRAAKNEVLNTGAAIKKRAELASSKNFLSNNFSIILGAFFIFLFLGAFKIFADGTALKENVMDFFSKGQAELKNAQALLGSQNPEEASEKFSKALKNFQSAKRQISEADGRLKVMLAVLPQGEDGKRILSGSALLSEAGGNMLNFYAQIKNFKFTAEGASSDQSNKAVILSASEYLNKANKNLKDANFLLKQVNLSSVSKDNRAEFIEVSGTIDKLSLSLGNFSDLFNLLALILQKSGNIFFVFENNNELRPGGGFIGSFAAVKQEYGKISKIRLGSIYDLDGQLKTKILPPLPLLSVNDRWYLRDSNWFADFPASAKKITEFYEKEGGETPDLIAAVTPNLIIDLLKITGPVEMPKYKVTLSDQNFVEVTQVLTTMSEDSPENQPKQFLADLMPVLMLKLGEQKPERLENFPEILFNNFNQKQLLAYSRIPEIQERLNNYNWSGEIKNSDRDYLMVVSSNLGGTKSDLFIEQKAELDTRVSFDGKIQNELTLTYFNKLPELEHTFNTRFVRILTPKGSKLLSATGFDYKNFEAPETADYKFDPEARAWDLSTVKDVVTGTLIGEESGKTYFGNWLTLTGGQTRTVKFKYELPFTLSDLDHFSLLFQKQPGAGPYEFNYSANIGGRSVIWKSFDEIPVNQTIKIQAALNQDRFWGMVIQK